MNDTNAAFPASTGEPLAYHIDRLISFAFKHGLLQPLDVDAARNALLDLFALTEPSGDASAPELPDSPVPLLKPLLDAAAGMGLLPDDTLTQRDLFDARMMGQLMPRPSETNRHFQQLSRGYGIESATDWFYKLNIDSNYIRMDRIKKNGYWKHATPYGNIEITVNLSKPEKDPREIALLKNLPQANYPKCLLCKENVGYAGRLDHPARQNLRILPLSLREEQWYFQYSPYVYYNEHSIVFRGEHVPMQISPATFERLLNFVEQFPHYFIGSNADLPIVGGSILNHDHFQAGRHTFAMETAAVDEWFSSATSSAVTFGIVRWPMSVLRLRSENREAMLEAANEILAKWREYSDPSVDIIAYSGSGAERVPHNTITPIARFKDNSVYELDLVLRNNRTSAEHPDGIFHPHADLHHIKRENIGLIEVMGLAVLPGRLETEIGASADILTGAAAYDSEALSSPEHPLRKHAEWIGELVAAHGTQTSDDEARRLLQAAVGEKFLAVLRDAGVFKNDAEGQKAFRIFLTKTGLI